MSTLEATSEATQQLIDEALCRSALYGALSLALYCPTAQTFDVLQSETAQLAFRQAAGQLSVRPRPEPSAPDDPAPEDYRIDLVARVDAWIETLPSLSLGQLLGAHARLFGHTARGRVCPYEAEYGPEGLFQQPRRLANILGFYRAFGLTTRAGERERADHVSCELEFLDFLSRKEAYALACGDHAMLEATRRAIRLFLKDHLGRFGRAFARQLRDQEAEGFFGKLANFLFDFVTFECRRLRIPAGSPMLRLRPAEEAHVPMACGGEAELVQLETPQ